MKKISFTLLMFLGLANFAANAQTTDILQKQLDTAQSPCMKLGLYTAIADNLIEFNQPKTREITFAEAGQAVDYVLKAIHLNAKNDDTLALRDNFDCLSQAYFTQKKYTQAKWFNLQSNCISRDLHDIPHIIYSLQQMAVIKSAIKDHKLAEQDLNEAIVLAKYSYNLIAQIDIEKQLAAVYDKAGDVKQALAIQKHYSMLAANLKKAQTPTAVLAMQKVKVKAKAKPVAIAQVAAQPIVTTQYNVPVESKISIENGIWVVKD